MASKVTVDQLTEALLKVIEVIQLGNNTNQAQIDAIYDAKYELGLVPKRTCPHTSSTNDKDDILICDACGEVVPNSETT